MGRKGARLGQHFLTAPWVAHTLVSAANITHEDTVLEIGPGKGALTSELLRTAARVVAVEKDPELITKLSDKFSEDISRKKLILMEADIRNTTPHRLGLKHQEYVLAANIPYYITGEIIRAFLTSFAQPKTMALLMQKEVANRIAVSTKESLLSLSVKAYGTPARVAVVPRTCFRPPPSVDSAILIIKDISRNFFTDIDEESFFALLHAGFSSKRKQLINNLKSARDSDHYAHAFAACGIPAAARAENVRLPEWKCLAQHLAQQTS
jgi:16S rRNA (adenine1518-N6/adenine1519-N6)-dimethyltransferase